MPELLASMLAFALCYFAFALRDAGRDGEGAEHVTDEAIRIEVIKYAWVNAGKRTE